MNRRWSWLDRVMLVVLLLAAATVMWRSVTAPSAIGFSGKQSVIP